MEFATVAPSLAKLDELECDTLVLGHFSDERPLRGVGGLVDWRLNGRLSGLLLGHKLTGAWGEQLLYPQNERLPFSQLLYFGLGDRAKFSSTRFKEVTNRMLRTLMRIGVTSFATCLPGRPALKLVPRQLIDLWLSELQKVFVSARYNDLDTRIVFLEPPELHEEMDEQLSVFARQHTPIRARR